MSAGVKILVEGLLADATISGLVGERVRGRKLPTGFDNSVPAIVVQLQAGGVQPGAGVDVSRYVVKCYGGSSADSDMEEVLVAVRNFFDLNRFETESGAALLTEVESFTGQNEPATGWPEGLVFVRATTE